jgi:nucleotide-binding universal stress UspA family protein
MEAIFQKILCPIDFSQSSLHALDESVKLARMHDALLFLMHVQFVPLSNPARVADYVAVSTEPAKAQLEHIARPRLVDVRHQLVVKSGRPAEIIEDTAEELNADLIAMATSGRTGVENLLLGSVAGHVVRATKRPVLTFAAGSSLGRLKKILCPVDFDDNSLAAVRFGTLLAQEYGAAMTLFHVVPVIIEPLKLATAPDEREWEERCQARLQELAEGTGRKTECRVVTQWGDPANGVLQAARELRPDVIVMATHGRKGLSRMALGSVAERVVRESRVPVLTIRSELKPG